MDVITGVAYTPVSSALNFHSADGSQRTANRLVLHPTPEGPFHERSFSCTMQIYTALHFMAQPVFPIYELEIFPVVVPIRAWSKFIMGKVVFHYLDNDAARSTFIRASASTSLSTTLVADYVDLNTNAFSLIGLQSCQPQQLSRSTIPLRFFSEST